MLVVKIMSDELQAHESIVAVLRACRGVTVAAIVDAAKKARNTCSNAPMKARLKVSVLLGQDIDSSEDARSAQILLSYVWSASDP